MSVWNTSHLDRRRTGGDPLRVHHGAPGAESLRRPGSRSTDCGQSGRCGLRSRGNGHGDELRRALRGLAVVLLDPSAIAFAGAIGLVLFLRDTPTSVGLPELEGTETGNGTAEGAADRKGAEYKAFLMKHVFRNPLIWTLGVANFFSSMSSASRCWTGAIAAEPVERGQHGTRRLAGGDVRDCRNPRNASSPDGPRTAG